MTLSGAGFAHAEFQPKWEFSGASSASYFNQSYDDDDSSESFEANVRASRFILDRLAVFAQPYFEHFSPKSGSSRRSFSFLVGPQYSFDADIQNAFYAFAGIGLRNFHSTELSLSTTALKYSVGLGKRFELFEHVYWSPELNFVKYGRAEGSNPAESTTLISHGSNNWVLRLFQFGILL